MSAFSNAVVLLLLLSFGCFGSRGVPYDSADGGDSSESDSSSSGRENTGGNVASLDAGARPIVCGDNIVEGDEMCDGTDLAGATCGSLMPGYIGTLECARDCLNYDTSRCYRDFDDYYPICGNNITEEGEVCDGTDLGGASCQSLITGYVGDLSCAPDCLNYNTAMCYPSPGICGNNIREAGEVCDGFDLAGATCGSLMQGMVGSLHCAVGCHNYDTSRCYEEVDDGGV